MEDLFDGTPGPVTAEHQTPTARHDDAFRVQLRTLINDRLSGRLEFEAFCWSKAELHFRYGRVGYGLQEVIADIDGQRQRVARAERQRGARLDAIDRENNERRSRAASGGA